MGYGFGGTVVFYAGIACAGEEPEFGLEIGLLYRLAEIESRSIYHFRGKRLLSEQQ